MAAGETRRDTANKAKQRTAADKRAANETKLLAGVAKAGEVPWNRGEVADVAVNVARRELRAGRISDATIKAIQFVPEEVRRNAEALPEADSALRKALLEMLPRK